MALKVHAFLIGVPEIDVRVLFQDRLWYSRVLSQHPLGRRVAFDHVHLVLSTDTLLDGIVELVRGLGPPDGSQGPVRHVSRKVSMPFHKT